MHLESFGTLFQLRFHQLIVILHNCLDCDCARYNVTEPSHPHVSVLECFCAENVESLRGLKIQAVVPPLRHRVLYILPREVAVQDVSKNHYLDLILILFVLIVLNVEVGRLKINNEVPLRMNTGLEQLNFLDEFPQIATHLVLGELACL
jgi:hypothetical protein